MQRVGRLLEHLAKQSLITDVFDKEIADQALTDHQEDIKMPIADRFHGGNQSCLMFPPIQGYVGVQFNDAIGWLLKILGYNWLMYPDNFDLGRVEKEVLAFLA
jgi:hypothetical protein